MSIEERVRTEIELYKQYSEPTPFVKDVEDLLVELDGLKERLRGIEEVYEQHKDSADYDAQADIDSWQAIKKACEVKE